MKPILRVLNIEDSDRDAALLQRYLSRAGYDLIAERVDTPAAMTAALTARSWDVILCDYSMPNFDALRALALVKELELDLPFIIISGTVGEAVAVEAMRAGAHDYLMKDNLVRLAPIIERELHEAENRRARRQAEESLKASEAELRALFAAITDVIFVLDAQGRYLRIAPTDPTYLYEPSARLMGKTLHEVFPEVEADYFLGHIRRALEEGRAHRVEYSLQIDGTEVWFDGAVSPMTKDAVVWVARDITERKCAEEEKSQLTAQIDRQRRRLNNIIANVPGVVWEAWGEPDRANQRIDFASNYVEKMLGYSVEEWLSTPNFWLTIVHPEDRERAAQAAALIFTSGESKTLEFRWIAKDGQVVWVEANTVVITDEQGRPVGMRGVTTDISERKMLEEQFRQAQKMEAIGQLAGGVAHDFNTLLTVIKGYCELTTKRLQAEDPLRRNIEEIEKAGNRAAALTRQLLIFSRREVLQVKSLDLNSIISELGKMLHRLIGGDIELRITLMTDPASIKADPGQIEQVIMNLAVNARDAMPHGGKLTIETAQVLLDEEYARQHPALRPGPYILLAVSDTGIGMDEQTLKRIFEPFFTTKAPGKGTGLGLSTVYGIVKQLGGDIQVYSKPQLGTTFKLYFPYIDEGAADYKPHTEAEEFFSGTETILLAEDEESARKLVREMLEMFGYYVLEAANGKAALFACEQHQKPIHLLLTDVVMPEISGHELAERLAAIHPETTVLYMSGYLDDTIANHGIRATETPFLQKPFTMDTLARKVREVLDAAPHNKNRK